MSVDKETHRPVTVEQTSNNRQVLCLDLSCTPSRDKVTQTCTWSQCFATFTLGCYCQAHKHTTVRRAVEGGPEWTVEHQARLSHYSILGDVVREVGV